MFFRNLSLFRFPSALGKNLDALEDRLAEHPLKPVGALELTSRGFVSPFGREGQTLSHRIGNAALLTLGGEDKLLPAAVVNATLAERLAAITAKHGRRPGGRERRRLREEVLTELLPRALAKPSRLKAYLDLETHWLLIDTASRKAAEGLVSALRNALGSFPALPVNAEKSPRGLLTAWLAGERMPNDFTLGDECELRDSADARGVVKCQRQDLTAGELRQHLKAGKQVARLALIFDDRISFVLGEDMVLRKLKFLEVITETLTQDESADAAAELDAVFALMSGELRRLLARLEAVFSLSRAEQ